VCGKSLRNKQKANKLKLLIKLEQQKDIFITTFAAQFENNRVALYCVRIGKSNIYTLKELFEILTINY